MRTLSALLFAVASTTAAFGQGVITAYSHSGTLTATTTADQYIYTLGGGPRTGRYYYWRDVREQTTGGSTGIPLDGSSAVEQAVGTYYQPTYSVTGQASTSLVDDALQATYTFSLADEFVWGPTLPAHAAASASTTVQDILDFTISVDCVVTITPTGSSAYHIFVGGPPADSGSSYTSNGPITMVLLAGSYYVEVNANNSVMSNTQTGVIEPSPGNVTFGYTMTVTPADGGGTSGAAGTTGTSGSSDD
jgi:hypothetical protein